MPTRFRGTRYFGITWLVVMAVLLSGCNEHVPPTASTASSLVATFALRYNTDQFCPAAGGFDFTFRIDPLAAEAVIAIADNGMIAQVRWPTGFTGGTPDDPVVRDSVGRVVARDGERVIRPPQDYPNLHGYSVCFSGDSVWVMNQLLRSPSG